MMSLLLLVVSLGAASAAAIDMGPSQQLTPLAESLSSVGDPVLTLSPPNIKPGETQKLVVSCQYNPDFPFGVSTLSSLTIAAPSKEQPKLFEPLATINALSQFPKMSKDLIAHGGKSSAEFHPKQRSQIKIEIDLPKEKHAKTYQCVAAGTDRDGRRKIASQTAQVTVGDLSLKELEVVTRKLEATIKQYQVEANQYLGIVDKEVSVFGESVASEFWSLRNDVQSMARMMQEVYSKNDKLERLVKILDSDFEKSKSKDGRRYLVSKEEKEVSISEGQDVCRNYGGYLVEIENNQQLQEVVDLVKKVGGDSEVFFTGGKKEESDEGKIWKYQNSGRRVEFLHFAEGHPPEDSSRDLPADQQQNCLVIKKSLSGLSTALCSVAGKYVCEIPEIRL